MLLQERNVRKVLMTADTVGGVWTYALDLCRSLQVYGVQVCMALMGTPMSAIQEQEVRSISNVEVRQSSYKLEWMDNPWEDVDRAGEWLLKLEKEFAPDIIHLNGYVHGALSWNAPVVAVAHSCVLSWWRGVLKEEAPAEWNTYKQKVAQGLKAANAVVAISKTYADELQMLYGTVNNMHIIYNGRDTVTFYSLNKKMQVFAMGRIWDEAKNLSLLGKITNDTKLPILIAGNNRKPDTGELTEISNVQLLGTLNQAEVKEYLAQSYIYTLPASYEPFGLSVLEAAASGCLLLLADIPTLRELWQDTAMYFNPEKPEELDQLLDYAIHYPEECRHLVEQSTERAKSFSLKRMAESYIGLYESLVPEHKPW